MATAEEYASWIVANADKKGTPEFNTVAQAYNLAKGGMVKPKAPIETPAFEKEAAAIANATPAEVIAGYPAVRFAIGAADPVIGALQMGANAVGLGDPANEHIAKLERLMQAGKTAYGVDGIDGDRLAGNILSPVGLAAAKIAGPATSAFQRLRQGGTIGAVTGATTPVPDATSTGDYFGKAGINAALGGGVGVAIPGMLEAGKAGARGLRNILDSILAAGGSVPAAQRVGGRLANEVAGPNAAAVRGALETSQGFVPGSQLTAGQAAVPANSAEFSALQKIAEQANPSIYAGPKGAEAAQESARKALIATIANDPAFANPSVTNLRAAQLVRDANAALGYGKVRGDMINPIAPEEVFAARIAAKEASKAGALQDYGRLSTAAVQQENLANGGGVRLGPTQPNQGGTGPARVLSAAEADRAPRIQSDAAPQMNVGATGGTVTSPSAYPVPGQPRIPPRYTDNAQRVPEFQAGAQDAMTIATQRQKEADFIRYQLDSLIKTVGPENPKLAQLLQRPSMQKALMAAQEGAQEAGGYFPAKAGDPFSVGNLQRMKQALDDVIADPKTFGIKGTEAMEIGSTRNEFVKWLGKRSPGWAAARDQYAADSVPVNRMEIGKVLGSALDTPTGVGERPASFANALENARLTQKKAGGQVRYDTIDEALGPEGMKKAKMVLADLVNNANFENLATAGGQEASRIAGRRMQGLPQPSMLNSATMFLNYLTRPIDALSRDKILRQLAVDMQNPKEMARLMREATPAQRKALTDIVMRLGTANAANINESMQ